MTREHTPTIAAQGVAGGSANAKFDRRRMQHREDVERRRPQIIATAVGVTIVGLVSRRVRSDPTGASSAA